jgi:hypothetical protein
MFRTEVVEKIKTHILWSVTFFPLENRALCMIMCKNIVEPDRPQMTIWRIRVAGCIRKATNTNSEYVIIIGFSTVTVVTRRCLNVMLYVHCLSCLLMLNRLMWRFNLKQVRLTRVNLNLEGCMMLCREIIAVCSQIHTKHINTLCGQNVELLNVKPAGMNSNHWIAKCVKPFKQYH